MIAKRQIDLIFTNLRGELFELIESWGGERDTLEARKRQIRRTTSFYWKELVEGLQSEQEEDPPKSV